MHTFPIVVLFFVLTLFPSAAFAAQGDSSASPGSQPLTVGHPLPDMQLSGQLTAAQAGHMGQKKGPVSLSLTDVQHPVVILEVFSMYCPHCQAEAPQVNKLHQLIQDKDLGGKVLLIGVGAGNSQAEVDIFRNKYDVQFPLFPDLDFTLHKQLGEVGTPFFYVGKRQDDGYTVIDSVLGRLEEAEAFLNEVLQKADMQQGK